MGDHLAEFSNLVRFQVEKNQRKRKKRQILRPCRRSEKAREHEGDGDTNCDRCTWDNLQKLNKKTGRVGNWRMSWNHPMYCIVKICQNTEKSHGDLRRLVAHIYQPLSSSRIWHKVNFYAEFNRFEFRIFLLLDKWLSS